MIEDFTSQIIFTSILKYQNKYYFLQFCLRFYLIMRVKFVFDSKLYDDFSGRFLILCQSYST